jgi:CDP-2,3-bis-(O-geranylgeranyl)-sn-glycerol synthase
MDTKAVVILVLLLVANGAPIVARNWLRRRMDWPVDCGLRFVDGRPLFGPAKTLRGVVAAVIGTGCVAPLYGLSIASGALFGCFAMLGDLASSFTKRRLGVKPSDGVLGLDQVPEALFPLLYIRIQLDLKLYDVVALLLMFLVLELLLSRLLFKLHIRDRRQ